MGGRPIDGTPRTEPDRKALAGYPHGPGAPIRATTRALRNVEVAQAVILVEGVSDQIAIETLALRHERDLGAEGVAVLPIGGAQAVNRYLRELGPFGERLNLAGFCDADAAELFRRALGRAGIGTPKTTAEMATLGFHVCRRDLEDELIRAVGAERVLGVVDAEGELGSFETLQKQLEWRGRPVTAQLRRFIAAKARRGQRYARLLIEAVDLDRAPQPLDAVLDRI